MTVKTVYDEVAALCTEGRIDNEAGFFAALNRALAEVNELEPMTNELFLEYEAPQANGTERSYDMEALDASCLRVIAVYNENGGGGAHKIRTVGNTVFLSGPNSGLYRVLYEKAPPYYDSAKKEASLGVRRKLYPLVVLLTAYYICVEDENPKADAFLARYRALSEEVVRQGRLFREESVHNRYGW